MASKEYRLYYAERTRLSNRLKAGNRFGTQDEFHLPALVLEKNFTTADLDKIRQFAKTYDKTLNTIRRVAAKDEKYRTALIKDLSPFSTNLDFNIVGGKLNKEQQIRINQYNRMKATWNRKTGQWRRYNNMQFDKLPDLPDGVVPTKRDLSKLNVALEQYEYAYKKNVSAAKLILENIEDAMNIGANADSWTSAKAEMLQEILSKYYDVQKLTTEDIMKLNKTTESLDSAIERLLYDSEQSFSDTVGAGYTDAYDVIITALDGLKG